MTPTSDLTRITQRKLLVVEGNDERLFFQALLESAHLADIQVMPIGGKTKLRASLATLVKTPGFDEVLSLGVTRDADNDAGAAFQSVCDALRAVNLVPPSIQLSPGTGKPKVGVMILPGQGQPGMLEDLCIRSIESGPSMACVNEYFGCLEQKGLPPPRNMSKAKVQAFLASTEEPGKRLGEIALLYG